MPYLLFQDYFSLKFINVSNAMRSYSLPPVKRRLQIQATKAMTTSCSHVMNTWALTSPETNK